MKGKRAAWDQGEKTARKKTGKNEEKTHYGPVKAKVPIPARSWEFSVEKRTIRGRHAEGELRRNLPLRAKKHTWGNPTWGEGEPRG